ncbi:MAG: right-handed parallel beta-helix repeat-containing protein, partial [Mucilaginibacter sp.]
MKLSIGLIMPLIVIFSITSCKKDLTPAPTSSADTNIANNFSSTVFNSGVKRAVAPTINYIGFITSFASTSYVVTNKINLTGAHNITISGKNISGGQAPAITLNNCYNIHITQNKLGNSSDVGIALYNCKNITIDYNYISNVSCGVYVENVTEGGITVINNQFKNIKGPSPRGQFVQFNTVS